MAISFRKQKGWGEGKKRKGNDAIISYSQNIIETFLSEGGRGRRESKRRKKEEETE